jgi:hypothetical protein
MPFRLNAATLGIVSIDGQNIPIIVPKDAIVQVSAAPVDQDRLLDVVWEGRTIMMFTIDLRHIGIQTDGTNSVRLLD